MQRIDIHIQDIAVLVNDAHRFLQSAIGFDLLQAAVYAHAMIDMRDIISRLQFPQRAQGDRLILIIGLLYLVFMIALEYLVIGIANDFQIVIDKSFMNRSWNGRKMNDRLQIFKNGMQSFQLLGIFGKKVNGDIVWLPSFSGP